MEPACRFGSNNRAPLWFCWFVARTRRIGCVTSDCTTRVGVDASRQCTTRCRFRIKLRAAGRKGPIAREVRRMVWQGRDQQQWCPLIQGWTLILHWVWALNSIDLTASWKSIPKSLTIFICRPTKKLSRTTSTFSVLAFTYACLSSEFLSFPLVLSPVRTSLFDWSLILNLPPFFSGFRFADKLFIFAYCC